MKISAIIMFVMLVTLQIRAQDYIINFAASGDTNVVSYVNVVNLASGASLTVNGADTIHLISTVGINYPGMTDRQLQLFPNPANTYSLLVFHALNAGNAILSIVDLSGKVVCQASRMISAGTHTFRISGISRGIFFVKVHGDGYWYGSKLVSMGDAAGNPEIAYESAATDHGDYLKNTSAVINMYYTEGDQLIFKGTCGNYTTIVPDVPAGNKTIMFEFAACTDADNKNYPIVHIGSQTWMAENLDVGARIDGALNQTNNGIIEKYCYNNDVLNCTLYGGLYQWNELMQYTTVQGSQGICPTGWNIPTDAEWCDMNQFLDPTVNCNVNGWTGINAGGKIKSTGTLEAGTGVWHAPNGGATNETGFTGHPAGLRDLGGLFSYMGYYGYWWTSTELNTGNAWSRSPDFSVASIVRGNNPKEEGYSLRCIKN